MREVCASGRRLHSTSDPLFSRKPHIPQVFACNDPPNLHDGTKKVFPTCWNLSGLNEPVLSGGDSSASVHASSRSIEAEPLCFFFERAPLKIDSREGPNGPRGDPQCDCTVTRCCAAKADG